MAISTLEHKSTGRQWIVSDALKGFNSLSVGLRKSGRVPPKEIIFFADQLSLLLSTGTPLNKSIEIISFQVRNNEFRRILQVLVRDIEDGRLLSQAMSRYPGVFSSVYVSMIMAGESGGFLKDMLEQIVSLETKNQEFLSTVKAAMYYPVFKFISGEKGRMYVDTVKLRIPVLKDFFIKLYVSRLMRTLGALVNGNVPLLDSLSISSGVVGNKVFAEIIARISRSVEDGKTISQPVSESPYFPETVKQMISTAEDTGTLDKVMPRLADYYDKDIERSLKRITTVIEPVLLVIMGGVIGVIVISLILPIFKLTKSIH